MTADFPPSISSAGLCGEKSACAKSTSTAGEHVTLPERYTAAKRALAEAIRIDEVKDIRDKALAMEVYAYQAKDTELVAAATELRERAVRAIGLLIAKDREAGRLAKGTQGRGRPKLGGSSKDPPKDSSPKDLPSLADQGVDKHLADRARKAAALSEDKFEAGVARSVKLAVAAAENEKAVIKAARADVQKEKRAKRAEREKELADRIVALPDKRYGVIVADPEWDDAVWSRETGMDRHASNHYPTSDPETIKSRPVCDIAAKDCVLFLWSTNQHLRIAMDVLEAWGFEYKSNYVWGKDSIGTGRWNRSKHEILLIGVCGNIPCPAPGDQRDSLIMATKGEHSEKPECFLEMIEEYFPTLPKIELNRRGEPRPGWDAWGFEAKLEAAE
jgi:N6-adenosine-specific RNA methylase IME4